MIFEGDYIDGKKNGNIREYNDGMLIFEGEYKHGKKNGKGKEYYCNGDLRFDGEYKDDNYWNGKINDRGRSTVEYKIGKYIIKMVQ